jgi:thiol:disulfide interchange protein DsbD
LYVGQTGDIARGATALFALGLGMGLPLILAGTFGSSILPRSGAWLLATRQLFGVLFLGVAALLIGRIVPPAISLAIWAALLIGTGVFLGAFDPLRHRAGAVVRLRKTGGILAAIYGVALLVGAAAGANDPLRPLAFASSGSIDQRGLSVRTINSPAALDEAMRDARDQGRIVMIDYSAEWCTACKTFERDVLASPDIQRKLDGITVIRADVTATNKDTTDLMRRYDVVGPPTLVFVSPRNGEEIRSARSVGDTSVADFGRKIDLAIR